MKRVTLVGGGTAGHVEPALAVAEWLKVNSKDLEIQFIGTKKGIETTLLKGKGIVFKPILKVPFPRKLGAASVIWPVKFLVALIQSALAIRGSQVIMGFGGYVAAPVYLAAKIAGIPILIHEANAQPGLANRLGAKLNARLFIAFEKARSLGGSWSSAENIGIPIKPEIDNFQNFDRALARKKFLATLQLENNNKNILIFGGSIGSQKINEVISESLPNLAKLNWNIIHVLGRANKSNLTAPNYRTLDYIDDMAGAYSAADFIICRSGAVTCHELMATGVPALLVPLEIGNGEQESNAMELVENQQGVIVKNRQFTPEWISQNLFHLLENSHHQTPKPPKKAAARLGAVIDEIISGRK